MDYPRNLREFDRLFAHKDACLKFLEQVRWGEDFHCQVCGGKKFWALATGLRRCQACRFKNSVKSGTIFESSRLPLKMWFYAIWWITAHKGGVSALDLQKDVGLGSYRSAWLLLHKIRHAMLNADRTPLEDEVAADSLLIGNETVFIAVEFSSKKNIGRIRMERARGPLGPQLEQFLEENIAKGSALHTTDARPFTEISRGSYRRTVHKIDKRKQKSHLPQIHQVTDHLHKWLRGTLHGRVDSKHLESYLQEFVFRFNRRNSKARGLLFQSVIENAVRIQPAPYRKIVARRE